MVKAIIFDCFGVLVTEAWLPFKAKYFRHDSELFDQASDLTKRANQGLISQEDFIRSAAELAGIEPSEARDFISRNVPDEQLFDYLRKLKPDYKLGFLSNIAANYLHKMFTPEQLALFDVIELSYESGFVKPETRAYQNIAKRLGIDISEAVLVDDQERNVNGASQAGMPAILYENLEQLKIELEPLLAA